MDATDFNQIISEGYGQFTKGEKLIANYLRRNQDESAFLSVGELAARLGLSEATLVRFARKLGFDSYPAMRESLQENFRRRVSHSARLRNRLDDLRQAGDIFEKVTVSEIDYLTEALQTVDRQALQKAVDQMSACEHIYVFATGPSISLVHLLNLRLTRFGKQVIPLTLTGRETLEPLLLMTERDLLFAIGFFDVNPTLQIVLDYAREVNCPSILLTDTLGSVVGEKVDIILAAKRGPVSAFHSLVVPMTIINALLLEFANKNQELVTVKLDTLDQLRERLKKTNGSSKT
ncbi:MAG: MurR/RpiR family transcriptional regulator [Anaerolineales bacterium]|jgi:DNA-binding MurR/RpiR family transcriptional regulator|nr:MurR/RpiR family transcriptional regulator [Anaerolineales bacterium]